LARVKFSWSIIMWSILPGESDLTLPQSLSLKTHHTSMHRITMKWTLDMCLSNNREWTGSHNEECILYMHIYPCKWVPVTTAWRVLGLRMEERPPGMEGSCEYIE
jgi:hypothetical protein